VSAPPVEEGKGRRRRVFVFNEFNDTVEGPTSV
jgi:hypothetical protein